MGSCMSLESQQPKTQPPVAKVVQHQQPVYLPPSAYGKPLQQGYTYAYPPQTQTQTQTQTQWINPSYQTQMYPQQPQMYPPQQQHYQYQYPQYPPQQQQQQQYQGPSTGMAVAGGLIAGMLAANVLDDMTDPY